MTAQKFFSTLCTAASLLTAGLAMGCGASTTPPGAVSLGYQPVSPLQAQAVPSPQPSGASNNMANNPFILWVKKNYPTQAAQVITAYLANPPGTPDDPSRDQLRQQALQETAKELQANVQKGVPTGFTATVVGTNVQVVGVDNYQGHNIYVRFEFWTRFLPNGDIEITQPTSTTYAQAEDLLAAWFGGDITAQAQQQITAALDKAGPPNAKPNSGITYQPGGTFIIDPGKVFVGQ